MYTFLSSRNLAANPLRSTLTALAIMIGVAMVLAASIVGQAANERAALDAPQTEQAPSPVGAGLTPFDQPTEVNTQIVQVGLGITGVMLVFAAGFVILNAFAMTITARQREIGALRALGMTRAQVTRSVLGEAAILALAGVSAGIPVGLLLARGVMAAFGTLEDVPFRVPWWGLGLAITLGLVITIGAALQPARRASRVPPLRAIRPGAEDVGESFLSRKRGLTGILILASTLVIFIILGPLLRLTIWPAVALASLGFILLIAGTVLALPSAVGRVARLAGKWLVAWFGVAGRLAGDNFRRNPIRSALTTGGMIAGLTTIIILSGVMTVLMEQGFTSFALMMREDRFVSPNIVSMFEAGEISFENMSAVTFMTAPLDPDLVSELEVLEQMGRIELERIGAAPIQPELQISPGFPAVFVEPEIYLRIGNFDFFEGDAASALAMMENGNAVLVMPLIAERFGAGLGDAIPVQTPHGEVMFTIAGIGGNGWNMPAFSLADGMRFFDIEPTMLGIVISEGQDREVVLGEVEKIIDDYPDRMLLSMQHEFLEVFEHVQRQFRALLNALLSLGVLLAGLGVVNTMVINIAERGREIGMLRAVGATRRQVRQSIVVEASTLGLMAAIISILLSFLMITVFIAVVAPNAPNSIGLRIDSDLTSRALSNAGLDMGMAALFSLVFAPFVAALAAYFPARQAAALNVVEATRSERLSLKTTPAARPESRPYRHRITRSHTWALAWRELAENRARAIFSALAVSLGVAMTIAGSVIGAAILNAFADSEGARTLGVSSLWEQIDTMLSLVGVLITGAAGFVVYNAFSMAVTQRTRQIGALRSLGMTRRQVMRLVLVEALVTGGAGTSLGLIAGPLLGRGIIALLKALDTQLDAFVVSNPSGSAMLLAAGLGMGMTLLSVLIPARQATKISPLVALCEQGTTAIARIPGRQAMIGLTIISTMAVYLIIAPPGEWSEMPLNVIMAGVFVLLWIGCLGLILPALPGRIGETISRPLTCIWGAAGRLIADNVRRDRRRVTLTTAALAVSVGLIVSMTGFTTFLMEELLTLRMVEAVSRQGIGIANFDVRNTSLTTFTEPFILRLPPEVIETVYETAGEESQVMGWYFVNVPELSFLMPEYPSMVIDPLPSQGVMQDLFDIAEGEWENVLSRAEAGCTLLLTPMVASDNGVVLGDTLAVTASTGPVDCVVAGIGASLGGATMIIGSDGETFGVAEQAALYVFPPTLKERERLLNDLRTVADRYGVYTWEMTEVADMQTEVFGLLQTLMNGMLLLAVAAAGMGVINTTIVSVAQRRRELGMLRATGATRRQATAVVVGEAALMGVIGGTLGLVAGLGFTVILVTVIGGNDFGFVDLDLWASAGRSARPALLNGVVGIIAAPLISAGAAWLPARHALRGSAIETMGEEQTLETVRRDRQRIGARSLGFLAWRNLAQGRTRTILSALAVALGVAMTIAADIIGGATLGVLAESELAQSFGQGLFDQMDLMLKMIGMAITVAAGFLVYNAFGMAVTQRRQQIGALRSLGMTRGQVIRLVLLEGMITALIGVALGLAAGPLMGRGTITLIQSLDIFINAFAESIVDPGVAVMASLLGIGVTLASVLFPARRAASVTPLEALRLPETADIKEPGIIRKTGFLGFALLSGITIYLAVAPPARWVSAPADYLLTLLFVALWIVGLGLILPAVIGWIGRVARGSLTRSWGAVGRLVADNFQRGRARVSLTTSTLAVALALVIGMTGFMAFAMDTLMWRSITELQNRQGWTVTTIDISRGTSVYTEATPLSPERIASVYAALDDRANIVEFNFVIVPELSFLGDTYFSFVLDPEVVRDTGTLFFEFDEGDWETAMPIMQTGCGVLIPPLIASNNSVGLGETFTVTGVDGPVKCSVAGLGSTFVLASIIGEAAEDDFGIGEPFSLFVTPKPGVDMVQLKADLHALGDELGLHVLTTQEFTGMQRQAFDQIRVLFNAMLMLAMVTAALGVVNTTVISVTERRRELGLLRAVGAKRRQVTGVVTGEAVLVGLIGGVIGLTAGVGFSLIVVLVYGGNSWGIEDLDLWLTTGQVAQPALVTGLLGLIAAPFVAAAAAWLPARPLTRGTAIETLSPEAHREPARRVVSGWLDRGSIRTRFVLGTGVLLVIVLAAIVGFVTNHARVRLMEQIENVFASAVAWNASALEAAIPDDADNLRLEDLQAVQFDTDTMLRFQAISQDRSEIPLEDFLIADRDGIVLVSLDPRQIGRVYGDGETATTPRRGGSPLLVSAPVRNGEGDTIGTVNSRIEVTAVGDFLDQFRRTLWTAGGVIILFGLGLVWALSTPLVKTARALGEGAAMVGRGDAEGAIRGQVNAPKGWFARRTTLRTRLTAAMVLVVVVMVGGMELITVPTERNQLERVLIDNLVIGGEWLSEMLSASLESLPVSPAEGLSFEQLMTTVGEGGGFHPAQLQELTERARGETIAYSAFVDLDGRVVFSDRLVLVGEEVSAPERTLVEEETWRGEGIWALSVPLYQGEGGEQVGVIRTGIRRASIETFLEESRLLLRLFMLASVLAAMLLAQAIGGAVTQPVRQLAADTRRVAQGDLAVQFRVDTKDEMAVLATAFNEMVAGLREREWLRDMFGRFVSQEVAEAIRTGQVRLEGENRVVSVLFCDIRGFTAWSEQHTPEEIVALLNEYLPVVVDAAQAHNGTVNKFGGDSTLVIYGAPRQLEESAYQAVLTALEMRANLRGLNERLSRRGEEPIRIGVGINTGMALAGAVGPEARQEYTVIGDTVNLASRIEALNKEFPEYDILISGQTYDALGSRRAEFAFVDLGEMAIRGKAEGVRVWAVEGPTPL